MSEATSGTGSEYPHIAVLMRATGYRSYRFSRAHPSFSNFHGSTASESPACRLAHAGYLLGASAARGALNNSSIFEESARQFFENRDCRILQSTFKTADIGPVDPSIDGKRFLRQAALQPKTSDISRDNPAQ
jgi:hypothetical protein